MTTACEETSVATDVKFGDALCDFPFTVPANYRHGVQLNRFMQISKQMGIAHYVSEYLTDENFANVTNKLESNKTYRVRIFPILASIKSRDCLDFLKEQNAILVGGQGLTLVKEYASVMFPVGMTVSFDKEHALWTDSEGESWLPSLYHWSDGKWNPHISGYDNDWGHRTSFLCITEIEE